MLSLSVMDDFNYYIIKILFLATVCYLTDPNEVYYQNIAVKLNKYSNKAVNSIQKLLTINVIPITLHSLCFV